MAAFALCIRRVLPRLAKSKIIENEFSLLEWRTHNIRHLYGPAYFGVDMYEKQRERVQLQFRGMKDKFITRMQDYLNSKTKNMIFTEDLKNMMHICENDPVHLEICKNMLANFSHQNSELRFGTFVFGPVIMRMYHHLNLPDMALQELKNPEMESFFDQFTSYNLVMDLLYKNNRFQEVLEVFELLQKRHLDGSKFPKEAVILALAACYKMNNQDSLDFALKLFRQMKEANIRSSLRSIAFASALALKQNNPTAALELLTLIPILGNDVVKTLKVMAYAQLDRVEDALELLQQPLQVDAPRLQKSKQGFNKHALEFVLAAINRSNNKEHMLRFKHIEQGLRETKLLYDEDFEESLCSPILERALSRNEKQNLGFASNFFKSSSIENRSGPMRKSAYALQRPGLTDMQD